MPKKMKSNNFKYPYIVICHIFNTYNTMKGSRIVTNIVKNIRAEILEAINQYEAVVEDKK